MATIGKAVRPKTLLCAGALLGVVALAAGCGGGGSGESSLAKDFAYDESQPIDLHTRGTERRQGVAVRDVSYRGLDGKRLDAYLIVPPGAEDLPAVIFAHGAGGNRAELVSEATQLAELGVVAITLDMAYSPLGPPGMDAVRARVDLEVDSVREVRRAVDVLRSLPEVDDDRIGYVGWSAGARMGAIVAGVEHRIKALDLIAGGAVPLGEYLAQAPPEFRDELEPLLGKSDPLRYVGHAAPSALLFQNGRRDEIVPQIALQTLAREGSDPKDVRWYDSGHVPSERAWNESRRWLAERLEIA
jgi:dienelactone hydrolase